MPFPFTCFGLKILSDPVDYQSVSTLLDEGMNILLTDPESFRS